MVDLARIARGLTKEQRREMLDISSREVPLKYPPTFRPVDRLYDLGLVKRANARWRGWAYVATDLGRAVAEALREMER